MLPQIEAYHTAYGEINVEYRKALGEIGERQQRGEITAEVRRTLVTQAERIAEVKRETAWDLLKYDADPMVQWIVRNVGDDYRDHAITVLNALPLDLEGLRQLREEQGWCDRYDKYLERAIEAGVVQAAGAMRQRMQLDAWLRRQFSPYSSQTDEFKRLVDQLIVAEVSTARDQWEVEQATDAENATAKPDSEQ
ncbi:MAG: hypothetical protein ACTHOG_12780 [Marmoricola sp.]